MFTPSYQNRLLIFLATSAHCKACSANVQFCAQRAPVSTTQRMLRVQSIKVGNRSTFHGHKVPSTLQRPFVMRRKNVRVRAAPEGGQDATEGVQERAAPVSADSADVITPRPTDQDPISPSSAPMSGKPPLDPVLKAAPLIDRPGSRPPSTEPATARPSTKAIGPLPEGLSCWLATQRSSDVEATLTGIRKGFLRHYSQHGTTATAKATGEAVGRNGSSHDNALQDKQVDHASAADAILPTEAEKLQRAVLQEASKYGEMVQAVYDTLLTKDVYSLYFGNCVPDVMMEGQKLSCPKVQQYTQLGDEAQKYTVLTRIEADSGGYKLVVKKARNYVGFIAESEPDANGAVDIAIVFRGTITKDEWVQDAKALKVRWRGGEQVISPPQIFLTSSPFKGNIQLALATAIGTFVLLSSSIGAKAAHWLLGGLSSLASQSPPLENAAAGLTGLYGWAVAALQHGVIDRLGIDAAEVNPELLSQAGVVGISVFLVAGLVSGIVEKPEDWLSNVTKLLWAVVPWMAFGVYTLLDGLIGLPWHDPRVSYGFKEMYCDALPYESTDGGNLKVGTVAYSPRLTIYKKLVELLQQGKRIKSITITGHSLGGALASMCGFDLATAIQEARTGSSAALPGSRYLTHDIMEFVKAGGQYLPAGVADTAAALNKKLNPITDMYREVRHQRAAFVAAIKAIRPKEEPVPAVAVVSFAAPRVGDKTYSTALGNRSIMCPMGVLEPLWAPSYRPGFWNKLTGVGRDWVVQAMKLPWHLVATVQVAWQGLWRSARKPVEADAAAGVKVGMLRVVNAHDVVPLTPITLPLPFLFYVHGGYELQLNSYLVPYFKNSFFGQAIGARHNLEMYLHLLDHNRDRAMVNKSDSVLTEDEKIPDSWWDPVPNMGLTRGEDGKWVRPFKKNEDSSNGKCS